MDDIGLLTQLLNTFLGISAGGYGRLLPAVNWLLATFITIELVFMGFMVAAGRAQLPIELFFKTLKIGFFIWLVTNFPLLHNAFMQSMIQLGILAGGGNLATSLLYDPSAIAQRGLWATQPLFNWFESLSGFSAVKALPAVIITGLCALVIIGCFFVMAIQVFVTLLEFYIVSLLALVLIPWGMLKQTAFMAEKAIGVIIAFAVKLMVLAFIVSVAQPTIAALALPVDPSYRQVFGLLLGSLALAFLAWQVPAVAAGLLMGSPSLTAGSAAMSVAGMAIGGVIGAQVVSHVGRAAGGAGLSALRAASHTLGAARAGAVMGAATTVGGAAARLSGGVSGAVQGLVGGALHQVQRKSAAVTAAVTQPVSAAAVQGQRSGFIGSGGRAPTSWQASALATQQANTNSPKTPGWAVRAVSDATTLAHMMTATAKPVGGIGVKF